MERTVTTVRARSRAGEKSRPVSPAWRAAMSARSVRNWKWKYRVVSSTAQRQPAQQPGELGQVPGWEEEGILLQRPETQGEGEGAQEPQVWMFLLQGGDGPAQQIPPHRIGEEGEAVKVDVQIEEEVGPGGVLDPADQF